MSKNEKGKKVLEKTLQKCVSYHYAANSENNAFQFGTITFGELFNHPIDILAKLTKLEYLKLGLSYNKKILNISPKLNTLVCSNKYYA